MNRLRRIVIVGRDVDAWLSGLTLQILFARNDAGIEVELIELPSVLEEPDFFSTLSSLKALHALLGLNETQILKRAQGNYSMGQRFSGWNNDADPYMHAYDSHGMPLNNIEFIHYWLRARSNGLNVSLEDFSLGAAAAKQGRFVLLNESSKRFSRATHGYHLSTLEYVRTIAEIAIQAGLKHRKTDSLSPICVHEQISELRLADGSVVNADLYIDASGEQSVLIEALQAGSFVDWSKWYLTDSQVVASARALVPAPAYAQINAHNCGWFGLFPLAKRTGLKAVYDSAACNQEKLIRNITQSSGLAIDDAIFSPLRQGMRARSWVGNCIAVGQAAASLEPLDAIDLNILQAGLSHIISLFPVDLNFANEAKLFNKKMNNHVERLRDFQLTHYLLSNRQEEWWQSARNMSAPLSLSHKVKLFSYQGNLAMFEDEIFQEESWHSIMIGHGLIPQTYNALAERLGEREQIQTFQNMLQFIAREVSDLPSLQAHVEMVT